MAIGLVQITLDTNVSLFSKKFETKHTQKTYWKKEKIKGPRYNIVGGKL